MSKKIKIILIFLSCVLLSVFCYLYYNFQEKKSEVVFFDVGQGDAILINLPGDNEILIDGGPNNSILYKLGNYLPIYNRDIELMILTHPHADHVVGLVEILKRYEVEKIILTKVKYNSDIYQEFLDLISEQGIETLKPHEINTLKLDEENTLQVLYPWEDFEDMEFENQNDNSIVVKLITKYENKFLFMGDIEANIENEILNYVDSQCIDVNILKAGHHGSDTSSSEKFIQIVSPDWAIISCGEGNSFGHPSLRTIKRLERSGAEILRTDKIGDIIFKINKDEGLELK